MQKNKNKKEKEITEMVSHCFELFISQESLLYSLLSNTHRPFTFKTKTKTKHKQQNGGPALKCSS